MEGSRPGVMLYFETLQAIEELEAEDAKQIMSAILHYSRDGELPALRGSLAAVWSLIRSGLDRDKARYGEKQIRGIWLTYCRKCKSTGETPLAFDEWVSTQYDNDTLPYVERTVNSAVNVPSPTTSPSTTTNCISNSNKRGYRGYGGCASGAHTHPSPEIAFTLCSPNTGGSGGLRPRTREQSGSATVYRLLRCQRLDGWPKQDERLESCLSERRKVSAVAEGRHQERSQDRLRL